MNEEIISVIQLADGSAIISDHNTVLSPWTLYVRIFDQVGMVQFGNGQTWTPVTKLNGTTSATIGDYEITCRRIRPRAMSADGVIDLRKARRFKAGK